MSIKALKILIVEKVQRNCPKQIYYLRWGFSSINILVFIIIFVKVSDILMIVISIFFKI